MQFSLNWLGPASSIATVIALIVTLLYYLYKWPFHLKRPENLTADLDNDRVKLRWNSVQRSSHYNIYRTNVNSSAVDISSCNPHYHSDTDLVAGEAYEYYVVAEDQGHQSPPSDVKSIEIKMRLLDGSEKVDEPESVIPLASENGPEAQWSVEDLRRLVPLIQNNKTVLTILDMTASKPDTPVSLSEICERADVTRRQGGTNLGTFTVLIKNRLGKARWPFTYPSGPSGPYYKLSKEMAERWRQAEAEGETR